MPLRKRKSAIFSKARQRKEKTSWGINLQLKWKSPECSYYVVTILLLKGREIEDVYFVSVYNQLFLKKFLGVFIYIYIYIYKIYSKSHIMLYMLLKFYFYVTLFSLSLKQHINVCFNITWIKLNFLVLKKLNFLILTYFIEI